MQRTSDAARPRRPAARFTGHVVLPGLVAAAALGWVPPVGLVIGAATWSQPIAVVPVHWGGGGADGFDSSTALLWRALVPSLATALVATAMALLLDGSSGRRSTAAAFAGLVVFGGASVLQWPVAQLTAADPALHDGVGPPFLLYLAAVPVAALAYLAALVRPRRSRSD